MFPYKFLLRVVLFSCIAAGAVAQPAQSSFSSFGVGQLVDPAQANAQGMAGVGIRNPQFWYLNNLNPALLVFNNFTTFQAGINGESRRASNGEFSHTSQDGNMNYLMLGFPLRSSRKHPSMSRWSTSLTLARRA